MQLDVNLFCTDLEAQLAFYRHVLGLPEAEHSRSPIYRAIEAPGFQFGFHAPAAYALLGLAARQCGDSASAPLTAYATFMLDSPAAVEQAAHRAVAAGGQRIQGPYPTYYGHWQVVLADPEGHVFRLGCAALPAGVSAPVLTAAG